MKLLAALIILFFLCSNPPAKAAKGDFAVSCPPGTYLTGFAGRVGDWIDQMRIVCSRWNGRVLLQPVDFSNPIGASNGGLKSSRKLSQQLCSRRPTNIRPTVRESPCAGH